MRVRVRARRFGSAPARRSPGGRPPRQSGGPRHRPPHRRRHGGARERALSVCLPTPSRPTPPPKAFCKGPEPGWGGASEHKHATAAGELRALGHPPLFPERGLRLRHRACVAAVELLAAVGLELESGRVGEASARGECDLRAAPRAWARPAPWMPSHRTARGRPPRRGSARAVGAA